MTSIQVFGRWRGFAKQKLGAWTAVYCGWVALIFSKRDLVEDLVELEKLREADRARRAGRS